MTHMRKGLVFGLVLMLVVMVAPLAFAQDTPSVTVNDQAIENDSVTIQQVVSQGPGWLVIHADDNGSPGPVLGHSAVTDGVNENVVVQLDAAGRTETLHAMLHTDAGTEGTYEFPGADTPVTVDGNVVNVPFQVTGGAAQETPTATVEATEAMTGTATVEATEAMTATATVEATEAVTDTAAAQATGTPEAQTLPETGGTATPWTGMVLLALGALVLAFGLGLAFNRR